MKRFGMLLMALVLCFTCAYASDVFTASVETPVFGISTETAPAQLEIVGGLKPGAPYRVLEVIAQDNGAPWADEWLQYYVLHRISYFSTQTQQQETGYIVGGYVEQPLGVVPPITQEHGHLMTIEGRSCPSLVYEAVNKLDLGYEVFSQPPQDAMPVEAAMRLALDAIVAQYGETEGTLHRFYVSYGYRATDAYLPGPYWQFDLRSPLNPLDGYAVYVHSPDGEVVGISGPGEGNG